MQAEPIGLGRHVFSIRNSDETIGAFDRQPQRPQMGEGGRSPLAEGPVDQPCEQGHDQCC